MGKFKTKDSLRSSFVSKEIIKASMKTETVKTEVVKKIETPDEWTIFRLETEKKID
jgi:hypothetical protein